MKPNSLQVPAWPHRTTRVVLMAVAIVVIFLMDTVTSYEVAVSVFYTVVILTMGRVFSQTGLVVLTGVCLTVTLFSFVMTSHGDLHAGLINMLISVVAILITAYLVHKAERARAAAHEAQARLLRISRIQSLEGLTTSIAHEINQPLAAIVTSVNAGQRWLEQSPPNLDKARQALARISGDAHRASSIIDRVRSLTKGAPPLVAPFVFNTAVHEVLALSEGEMTRHGIALTVNLATELPYALADRVQIQQVMGNLVLNAIEATALVPASRRAIQVSSTCQDNKIVFTVSDTGIGLPQGYQAHLFEAFWTTKKEGIGVGLSLSRAIVEANGGYIWAESNQPDGAVFAFSVPTTGEKV